MHSSTLHLDLSPPRYECAQYSERHRFIISSTRIARQPRQSAINTKPLKSKTRTHTSNYSMATTNIIQQLTTKRYFIISLSPFPFYNHHRSFVDSTHSCAHCSSCHLPVKRLRISVWLTVNDKIRHTMHHLRHAVVVLFCGKLFDGGLKLDLFIIPFYLIVQSSIPSVGISSVENFSTFHVQLFPPICSVFLTHCPRHTCCSRRLGGYRWKISIQPSIASTVREKNFSSFSCRY